MRLVGQPGGLTQRPLWYQGSSLSQRPLDASGAIYFIVGITNSAPSFTPEGQREVTVLVLV